ncbi:hypothetical protein ACQ4M3_39460 [Leptolyngbya sp. AN03gr2]|uniref:hypothetical protein n=1 Tax=unclassified Leptolyngbya TaxID=2650499 RepID=UPI003D313AF5
MIQVSNFGELAHSLHQTMQAELAKRLHAQGIRFTQVDLDQLTIDLFAYLSQTAIAQRYQAPLVQEQYNPAALKHISVNPNSAEARALFGAVPETVGVAKFDMVSHQNAPATPVQQIPASPANPNTIAIDSIEDLWKYR